MRPHSASAFLMCLLLLFATRAWGAGDSIAEVEKDLSSAVKEMDALRGELDRLEELAAFPRATGIRVEIQGEGKVPAPVRGRLLVQGKVEEEREWPTSDREAFSGQISIPVAMQLPYLPGGYSARLELFHPSWKTPASAEFRLEVRKGEIAAVRLRLAPQPGTPLLSLLPVEGIAR